MNREESMSPPDHGKRVTIRIWTIRQVRRRFGMEQEASSLTMPVHLLSVLFPVSVITSSPHAVRQRACEQRATGKKTLRLTTLMQPSHPLRALQRSMRVS